MKNTVQQSGADLEVAFQLGAVANDARLPELERHAFPKTPLADFRAALDAFDQFRKQQHIHPFPCLLAGFGLNDVQRNSGLQINVCLRRFNHVRDLN